MATQVDTRVDSSLVVIQSDELMLPPSSQNAIETTIQKFKELNRVPLEKGPLSPLPSPRPRAKSSSSPTPYKEEILFKYVFFNYEELIRFLERARAMPM